MRSESFGCTFSSVAVKRDVFESKAGSVFTTQNLTPSEYLCGPTHHSISMRWEDEERGGRYQICSEVRYQHPTANTCCGFEDHGHYYTITDVVPKRTFEGASRLMTRKLQSLHKEFDGYVARTQPDSR